METKIPLKTPAASTSAESAAASEANPWHQAMLQLDRAAQKMKLESFVLERLRHCKRILTVSVPVKMDDGSVRVFEGYRIQHNMDRGPAKGGIWTLILPVRRGRLKYLFLIDGEPKVDPAAETADGPEGRRVSVRMIP